MSLETQELARECGVGVAPGDVSRTALDDDENTMVFTPASVMHSMSATLPEDAIES